MSRTSPGRVRVSIELPVHGVTVAQVRELARVAEDAGLDGIWIPDHLVPLRPGAPPPLECWTLLAALAGATSRVRVGSLVLVLPLRDPGLLALQARTLAAVAPGRLVLGVGLGGFTYRRAAAALGITTHDLAARGDALADALERLRATAREGGAAPPALWVGGRSRAALEAAARAADGWNCPFVAEIEQRLGELDAACAAVGRDPNTVARSVYALVAVAPTEDEARRRAASAAAMAKLFGDVEREHVFGTPVRAAERLRALAALGLEEVALHLAGSHAERLDTIALLGTAVLPLL
jgi:alkanesulfonate monooxygenase SsuD/methylene tetrahydromethanopterin reductase-like flavin-dependent oxidoreductase (luciferase family)